MHGILVFLAIVLAIPRMAAAQRVVLDSVDGLRPDFYLDPRAHGASLPAFESLMREGVYAEGVEGVFPTVTYPSHTSIVTGARPARHGVLSNYVFDPKGRFHDWYWQAESIRVKSLWDAAPGVTAAIQWPATVGADIEVNLPEFWVPESEVPWGTVMEKAATPQALALTGPLPDVQPEGEARAEKHRAAGRPGLSGTSKP